MAKDPTAAAKVLVDFAKENDQRPALKGGLFEGAVMTSAGEEARDAADANGSSFAVRGRAERRADGVLARTRCAQIAAGSADLGIPGPQPESLAPGWPGELWRIAQWQMRHWAEDEILEAIGNMTVFELVELNEAFKTKFNVTIAIAALAVPRRRRRAGGRGAD